MAKPLLLPLSLCLLFLFNASLAHRTQQSQQQNQCQLDQIQAREPDYRREAEAGLIESWNPNNDDLQCAGVAVLRWTVESNGLHLPSYSNAPQLIYIVKGNGVLGVVFPSCPETYEESQQQGQRSREGRSSSSQQDRHQKIRHFREGDIIAIPAGVAYWTYNNGDSPFVAVALLDTNNHENQLDQNPRRFYLAGNPDDEFEPQQQGRSQQSRREQSPWDRSRREQSPWDRSRREQSPWDRSRREQSPEERSRREQSPEERSRREQSPEERSRREQSPEERSRREQSPEERSRREQSPEERNRREQSPRDRSRREQSPWDRSRREQSHRGEEESTEGNNVFSGFETRLLAEALNIDEETARKLQSKKDNRNSIVRVKGRLDFVSPPRSREEREREEETEREIETERRESRRDRSNGVEETFCSLRLKENIGDPSRADIYSPQAGRINNVNNFNLPILSHLKLSAERGFLYNNAIYAPHWNLNAHSVVYVIKGRARTQIVDENGNNLLNNEVRQGQLFVIPQNHAVLCQAGNEGFEYIAFKTNENAQSATLAGKLSVFRALPESVISNAFQVSREQARRLKYNREEATLLSSRRSSSEEYERRAVA